MDTQKITVNGRNFTALYGDAAGFALVEKLSDGTRTSHKLGFLKKRGGDWVDQCGRKCKDTDMIAALELARLSWLRGIGLELRKQSQRRIL